MNIVSSIHFFKKNALDPVVRNIAVASPKDNGALLSVQNLAVWTNKNLNKFLKTKCFEEWFATASSLYDMLEWRKITNKKKKNFPM